MTMMLTTFLVIFLGLCGATEVEFGQTESTNQAKVLEDPSEEISALVLSLHDQIEALMTQQNGDLSQVDQMLHRVLDLPSNIFRYDHSLRLTHRYMEQALPKSALPFALAALELNQTTVSYYYACWVSSEASLYDDAVEHCKK